MRWPVAAACLRAWEEAKRPQCTEWQLRHSQFSSRLSHSAHVLSSEQQPTEKQQAVSRPGNVRAQATE